MAYQILTWDYSYDSFSQILLCMQLGLSIFLASRTLNIGNCRIQYAIKSPLANLFLTNFSSSIISKIIPYSYPWNISSATTYKWLYNSGNLDACLIRVGDCSIRVSRLFMLAVWERCLQEFKIYQFYCSNPYFSGVLLPNISKLFKDILLFPNIECSQAC